jgi:hypothetical protein
MPRRDSRFEAHGEHVTAGNTGARAIVVWTHAFYALLLRGRWSLSGDFSGGYKQCYESVGGERKTEGRLHARYYGRAQQADSFFLPVIHQPRFLFYEQFVRDPLDFRS